MLKAQKWNGGGPVAWRSQSARSCRRSALVAPGLVQSGRDVAQPEMAASRATTALAWRLDALRLAFVVERLRAQANMPHLLENARDFHVIAGL